MSHKIRPDLGQIISSVAMGQIDEDHFERWQRFKGLWSVKDRDRWEDLLSRMHKNPDGTTSLDPPLSAEEKVWAKEFIRRAEALDLC